MLARSKLIILKTNLFSEADLIVTALNQKGEKMNFMAKGAVKSKRRFVGGVLEPSAFIEAEYRFSKKSLHQLQQAWFLKSFSGLRKDYDRLELAFYFLKVINDISQEGANDSQEIFHLLGNALQEAEHTDCLKNLKLCFQIKVLFLQGVLPEHPFYSSVVSSTLANHPHLKIESQDTLFQTVHQTLNHYLTV